MSVHDDTRLTITSDDGYVAQLHESERFIIIGGQWVKIEHVDDSIVVVIRGDDCRMVFRSGSMQWLATYSPDDLSLHGVIDDAMQWV